MQVETASLSLIGHRDENQDRVGVVQRDNATLAVVIDGMGGHEAGAEAAEVALRSMLASFEEASLPIFDPRGFLRGAVNKAHQDIVALGANVPITARPRATCVVALVQKDKAYWAHVGDSRLYLLRNRVVAERTRDHSHVELLLQEGLISEEDILEHPLRNYVEYCLGGEPGEPSMSVAGARLLERGDLLLLCTDGLWGGSDDRQIAAAFPSGFADLNLDECLANLMQKAVDANAPVSDNTTGALIHWLSD